MVTQADIDRRQREQLVESRLERSPKVKSTTDRFEAQTVTGSKKPTAMKTAPKFFFVIVCKQ